MTHTLLRTGDIESQKKEFCWLVYQSKGINDQDFVEKAQQYIATIELVGGDNWGDTKTGSLYQVGSTAIKENILDNSRIRGVFAGKEKAVEFLKQVIDQELGKSVILSGVISEISQICKDVGITPHSANFSLGVWGRKDKLPNEKILSISTMCGHHMVPKKYIEAVKEEVDQGSITPDEGAKKLAGFCYCGIFNPVRCSEILSE